jgi:preprotein translocase subunit YajC
MLYALTLLAEDAPKPAQQQPPMGPDFLLMIAVLFAVFYFVVMRPMKRRQEQERNALLNTLKKNDRILTIGGIYGTVVSVAENEDEVTVKVDDNTRLKVTKASIARNLSNEQAAKEAQDSKKKAGKEGAA